MVLIAIAAFKDKSRQEIIIYSVILKFLLTSSQENPSKLTVFLKTMYAFSTIINNGTQKVK